MTSADDSDLDGLAGEYVLGTLSPEERLEVESRLRRDAALRATVDAWSRRLQPLADAAPPAAPAGDLFAGILARIDPSPATAGGGVELLALRRSIQRWRAAAAGLAAAVVLVGAFFLARPAPPPGGDFVAVLTAEGARPVFVASVDVGDGTVTLRQIAGDQAPPSRAFELWAIEPDSAPRSLGLVRAASYRVPLAVESAAGVTLAISVEDPAGAPHPAPAGPVVFSGTLVPTE